MAKRIEKSTRTIAPNDFARLRTANVSESSACLQPGAKNVSEIADGLGVSIVNASHHLKVLVHAAVVQTQTSRTQCLLSIGGRRIPGEPDELDLGCCKLQIEPTKISYVESVYFNNSRIADMSTPSTSGATRETGPVSYPPCV